MWRQKEKNALCAADCFFVTHFPFRRPQSFRESARSPLFFLSFFLLFKHTGWLVMVAFSPSLKKSVYFPLTCLFAASQSLSVPLARVTHLFCLKVNVGQSSLIAKEWIYCKKKRRKKEEEEGEKSNISVTARHTSAQISQRFLSACRETPQVFAPRNYGAFEVRGRTQMASSSLQHASSLIRCCLLCFLFCFFLFKYVCLCWRIAAAHRCNDIQIGGVICQVHFASGSTMGRSVHCVTERQRKKSSITRRLYLQSNFIPPAMRGGLSSEPCLAFKCGKSAQSPPLTRNAARLSSWCSLNKLNNEGISEMPKRHYTPTIRARSE